MPPVARASPRHSSARRHALLLALAAMLGLHVWLFATLRQEIAEGYPDFIIFYTGGKMVLQGLGDKLYDPQLQRALQLQIAPGVEHRQEALLFNHPPLEALIFAPLARLSYVSAYKIWAAFNASLLFTVWLLLRRSLPNLLRFSPALVPLLVFAYFPGFLALMQGQDSILFLALITGFYIANCRRRLVVAGVLLAIGLFKFQLVLPLALTLLIQRRWRLLASFVVATVVVLFICVGVVGWRGMLQYPLFLHSMNERLIGIHPRAMPNLRGLVNSLPWTWSNGRIGFLLIATVSGILWLMASLLWRPSSSIDKTWNLGFSLNLAVAVLVSYHLNPHDLVVLLPPLLLIAEAIVSGALVDTPSRVLRFSLIAFFCAPGYLLLWFYFDRMYLMALVVLALYVGLAMAIKTNASATLAKTQFMTAC